MEGFGIEKLLLTLGIVMILFGGKRIPEIGASLGGGIRNFKKAMSGADDDPAPVPAPRSVLPTTEAEPIPEPKRLIG